MLPAQIAQAAALPPGGALTSWSLEPLPTIGIVIAGALYVQGLRSLRLRGGPPFNRWRATCFLGGLVVLFLALASPIDTYAGLLLSDHMVQHVLITMVAAPLLVLGTPVLLALRVARPRTRHRILVPLLRKAPVRTLASPLVGW